MVDRNEITTWQQGSLMPGRSKGWSIQRKAMVEEEEKTKVRPNSLGKAMCQCTSAEEAAWLVDRLNLAAKWEKEIQAACEKFPELQEIFGPRISCNTKNS